MTRRLLSVLCALALLLGVHAVARADEELKIGGVGPLSGGGTVWGIATMRAAQLAIDEVNAAGGLKIAGKTYRPTLVMLDDATSGQGGKSAAERLLFEKVSFIIGSINSPGTLGMLSVLDEAREKDGTKVIVFSGAPNITVLKNKYGAPYTFVIMNSNREYAPSLVDWYKQQLPNLKQVAVFAPNDAVGQTTVPTLVDAYKAQNIGVMFEMFERGTREFTPLITRMIATGADSMDLNNNTPGDSALMYRQARQAGFRGTILQTGGPADQEVLELTGQLANGFISYEVYDFTSDRGKTFAATYEKKYGKGVINPYAPIFYNATKIMFEGLRRADSLDPEAVRNAIEKLDGYDAGVIAPVKWAGKDMYGVNHQLRLPNYAVEIKGGKIVPAATLP